MVSLQLTSAEREALYEDMISICQSLIRIPSVNYGDGKGNEKEVALKVVELLAEAGITATIYESAPGRCNVIARIEGIDSDRAGLIVHGHLDVVPADAADWSVDPFFRDNQRWNDLGPRSSRHEKHGRDDHRDCSHVGTKKDSTTSHHRLSLLCR